MTSLADLLLYSLIYILYYTKKRAFSVVLIVVCLTVIWLLLVTTVVLRSTPNNNPNVFFEGSVQLEERYINSSSIPFSFPSVIIEKQQQPSAER